MNADGCRAVPRKKRRRAAAARADRHAPSGASPHAWRARHWAAAPGV